MSLILEVIQVEDFFYPKYDNKLLIGHKDKKFKEIIKNINKSHSSEKKTNNEIKSKKKINNTKKFRD